MNYDHNKKFGLLKFHSGYGTFYFNSPKGYNRKIINAQTGYCYYLIDRMEDFLSVSKVLEPYHMCIYIYLILSQ